MKHPRIVSSEFVKNNLDNPKSFSEGVLSPQNDQLGLFIQPVEERERESYEMKVLVNIIALVKMVALSRKNIEEVSLFQAI
jgi:hypothetical protein